MGIQIHEQSIQFHALVVDDPSLLVTSRRGLIGQAGATGAALLLGAPAAASAPAVHEDDELLRLGDEFAKCCRLFDGDERQFTDELDTLANKIRDMPANSLKGLAVKARVLALDQHYLTRTDHGEAELKAGDWGIEVMVRFVQEVERMAEASRA